MFPLPLTDVANILLVGAGVAGGLLSPPPPPQPANTVIVITAARTPPRRTGESDMVSHLTLGLIVFSG
jgi:hypothetical protein